MNRSTNFNFYLPTNADPMLVSDLTSNFETIDQKLGVANNLTTEIEGKVLDARQGKVLKDALDNAIVWKAPPTNGTNFNSLTSAGKYQIGNISIYTNYPSNIGSTGTLEVENIRNVYIRQECVLNLGRAHRFSFDNGVTWTAWV